MPNRVLFDAEARAALWRGMDQLATAVRITLGPRGRSVVFDRLHGVPAITRDGIAVAQEIALPDPFENVGVQMLREAAFHTAAQAGDGTSTATVLAHRLAGGGLAAVANGLHPVAVKRGMDRAVRAAKQALAADARPVADGRDLERIAIIAAGDRRLGEMLAHALERVGRPGVVTVEDGRGLDTTLEVLEGTRFDGGYASPYFITDAEDMEASLTHPLVALVDGVLAAATDVVPMLEHAARLSRPLLVLCEDAGADALPVFVVNRLRGTAPCVVVKLPQPPAQRSELLADLAVLTGASVVAPELGREAAHFEPGWFGRARQALATTEQTTLLQGGGRAEAVAQRVALLRRALAACTDDAEHEALRARLARLAGGVAVLHAGGANAFEIHARRSRLEDALAATRAAVEEGVLVGGGVGLFRAGVAVREVECHSAAERAGRDVVLAALAEPARQIAVNAGEDAALMAARLAECQGTFGFNALSGRWSDLAADGILDPAKVARCALENAASIAGLVLTTEVLVVEEATPEAGAEGGESDAA
ncbi:MAG: chaperonin GroEL [Candidatus Eisenbacteria bacterium]